MKTKRKVGFLAGALVLFFLLPVFFGCDNAVNPDPGSPAVPYSITYSAGGPELSRFLQWQWDKKEDGSDLALKWIFKNDGTISVVHCCGLVFDQQFSYLFCGNVLVTYGNDTDSSDKDKIEATVCTMSETGNGVSFTRHNGTRFIRGDADTGSSPGLSLVLSNDLLGTWQGTDGTEYTFGSDSGLRITSPSGSGEYGYLVRNDKLLTLGPLVDGETADLQRYTFKRTGNSLELTPSGGSKITLKLK
jgi:hypothetical protein